MCLVDCPEATAVEILLLNAISVEVDLKLLKSRLSDESSVSAFSIVPYRMPSDVSTVVFFRQ